MESGMMTVWLPQVIDNATGKVSHGLGYFATLWEAEDMAWECRNNALRKGYDVNVNIVTRKVPEEEARFWISTNNF